MPDEHLTVRIPEVAELAPFLADWDTCDFDDPLHRLSIAAYECPQLVVVPDWADLGFSPVPPLGAPRYWTQAGAEACPVTRADPEGPWEVYVEGDDTEHQEVADEVAARWWFAVVAALHAFAEVPA